MQRTAVDVHFHVGSWEGDAVDIFGGGVGALGFRQVVDFDAGGFGYGGKEREGQQGR